MGRCSCSGSGAGPGFRRVGRRGSGGFALPMVLAFIIVGTIITLAVLAYASTTMRAGVVAVDHTEKTRAQTDALDYLLVTMRTDPTKGVAGDASTATVAGVAVTCVGQPGSGVASGAGRTDRVVLCTTPSITAEVRFFDRSGAKPGVIEEVLRWDVRG